MIRLLEISNHTLFWYYLASNLAYLTMLIVALKTSAAHQRSLKSHRLSWFKESPLAPPITIIAPAHNEEKSFELAVRNLLELDYPQLEVIVVNDGSEDRTLDEMREEFRLRPVRAVYVTQAESAPVRGLYRSEVNASLLVVDKESGAASGCGERGFECGNLPLRVHCGCRFGPSSATRCCESCCPSWRIRKRRGGWWNHPRLEWIGD